MIQKYFIQLVNIKGGLELGNTINFSLVANSIAALYPANQYKLKMRLEVTSGNKFLKGGNGIPPYWGEDVATTTNRYWEQQIDSLPIKRQKHIHLERL
jgi:hypothetical protein